MPFLRAIIPFIVGIITYSDVPVTLIWGIFFSCIVIHLFTGWLDLRLRFQISLLPGFLLLLLVYCSGYFAMYVFDIKNQRNYIGNNPGFPLIGIISGEPRKAKTGFNVELDIKWIQTGKALHAASGKILARRVDLPCQPGDTVLLMLSPIPVNDETIRSKGYLNYLERRNITHTVSASSNGIAIIGKSHSKNFVSFLRTWLLKVMDDSFREPNERALAKALLVGSRINLDPDLITAYTNTGVIHVVAISGMHLAIIYAMISSILKPLQHKKTRLVSIALTISSLWIFSLICGASPSVVRSAVMFSFILIGEAVSLEHKIANTLAGSAFLLLSLQPTLVWDIGFQLSYSAVASLIMYSKGFSGLLMPGNKILIWAWNTLSTTMAAQILTTPLAIFHFQQFPLVFLLSNFVAVPISGLILILLFLICLLYPAGLSAPLAKFTSMLMDIMNKRILAMDHLSFATARHISLSEYDTVNIYIILIALTLWWRWKK